MDKNKWQLNEEEQEILEAAEAGRLVGVGNIEAEREKTRKIAQRTLKRLKKERVISLRLSDEVYQGLKQRAAEKGLPYQSLVSSLLHQYVHGQVQAQL